MESSVLFSKSTVNIKSNNNAGMKSGNKKKEYAKKGDRFCLLYFYGKGSLPFN